MTLTCRQCGSHTELPSWECVRRRRYCSKQCANLATGRALRKHFPHCNHCGKEYRPKNCDRLTYCSRECAYAHKTQLSQAHEARRIEAKEARCRRECTICSKRFHHMSRLRCSSECEREFARDYARENYTGPTAERRATAAKARRRFPERARARQLLWQSVRRGLVQRPDKCERCGEIPKQRRDGASGLHGHHYLGYSMPLNVRWLCSVCHGIEDVIDGHRKGRGPTISTARHSMSEWAATRTRPRN